MSYRQRLRIGSLNVWGEFADWPRRLEALQSIPDLGLDALLAQEVCVGPNVDQLRDLAEAFHLPYYDFHSDKTVRGAAEGVAIFAKEPLTMVGRTNLGNGRVLIQADSFGKLSMASAHLSFEGRERSEQVKALLKRVTLNRVVLGADFNGHLSTFAEALDKYWHDGGDDSPTWPVCSEAAFKHEWERTTGHPVHFDLTPRRMDYVLTRGVEVVNSETIALQHRGQYVSDHALVISDLLL